MCLSHSRRQFTLLAASAALFPHSGFAIDNNAVRALHGKLDIDKLKNKQRLKSQSDQTVFRLGGDAFLVDDEFEAELTTDEAGILTDIAVFSGQALAVIAPLPNRNTNLLLPNATGSIRGTGFYVNCQTDVPHDYICCCYGHIRFANATNGRAQELKNTYHNATIIDENGQFQPSPYDLPFGHFDDELVMLESQMDRQPHWQLPDGKMHFISPRPLPL